MVRSIILRRDDLSGDLAHEIWIDLLDAFHETHLDRTWEEIRDLDELCIEISAVKLLIN